MATISAAEYRTFVRNDFYTFMHRAFLELNPRSSFLHNWHHYCPAKFRAVGLTY
jgi:hypothetical protein